MPIYRPALWQPSYGQGYASRKADAANPGLWDGLEFNWHGPLGPTGLAAFDVSGKGSGGTLTNMAPASDWVTTTKGWALDFDGVDEHITTTRLGPAGNQPRTVAGWITSSGTAGRSFVGWGTDVAGEKWAVRLDSGSPRGEHGSGYMRGTATGQDGAWHHGALVFSGGTFANTKLYVDGAEDTIAASAGLTTTINTGTAETIIIGQQVGAAINYWIERMATATVWGRALAAGEIRKSYDDEHAIVRPMQRIGLSAPGVAGPYRALIAETFHTGAAAGEPFAATAVAGEPFHIGPTAGQIDG